MINPPVCVRCGKELKTRKSANKNKLCNKCSIHNVLECKGFNTWSEEEKMLVARSLYMQEQLLVIRKLLLKRHSAYSINNMRLALRDDGLRKKVKLSVAEDLKRFMGDVNV